MQWIRKQKKDRPLDSHGDPNCCSAPLQALNVSMSMAAICIMLLPVYATANNWEVEGTSGVLHVSGVLTESACRLEMSSARQDIWLGETGTGYLQQQGDQGQPVKFELRLKDCLRIPASSRDERTGALVWSGNQPAVSVSFSGLSDMDNPLLVKAQGVSGLALRLTDNQDRDVRLGSRGAPLILMPGQSALTYTVTPERTRAPLMAGAYRATVDFRLSYD